MLFETFSNFDSIIVIESLPEDESQTGLVLSRDTLFTESCLNSTSFAHIVCHNQNDFFRFFNKLENNILHQDNSIIGGNAKYPILHFEIHGAVDKTGLVLKNGDYIDWLNFNKYCRLINKITKNNLHVVLAVCNGYYAASKAIFSEVSPYYALIAPPSEITNGEILNIFPHFYKKLFISGNLMDAVEDLTSNYKIFHCEKVLMDIMANYFISDCEGEALELRVNSILNRIENSRSGDKKIPNRRDLIKVLKPSEETFNNYKKKFLMTDCTENRNRFSLSYNHIQNYMDKIRGNFVK